MESKNFIDAETCVESKKFNDAETCTQEDEDINNNNFVNSDFYYRQCNDEGYEAYEADDEFDIENYYNTDPDTENEEPEMKYLYVNQTFNHWDSEELLIPPISSRAYTSLSDVGSDKYLAVDRILMAEDSGNNDGVDDDGTQTQKVEDANEQTEV